MGGKSSAHNKLVNDAIMDKCAVQVSSLVAEAVSGLKRKKKTKVRRR